MAPDAPPTDREVDFPYGTILFRPYLRGAYREQTPFMELNMTALLILPTHHIKYCTKDETLEVIQHDRLYTLSGYEHCTNEEHIEYLQERILSAIRINLAYVLAYRKKDGSKTQTD